MEMTPEIRASHQAMSGLGLEFLQHMADSPQWHKPLAELIELPPGRARENADTLMTWPPLFSPEAYRHMDEVLASLQRLNQSLPYRLFEADPKKLLAAYPFPDEAAAAALVTEPDGSAGRISRSDLVWTAEGWKLLEINSSPLVAGFDLAQVSQALLAHPMITSFLEPRGLKARTPATDQLYFSHMVEETLKFTAGMDDVLNLGIWWQDVPQPGPVADEINQQFSQQLGQVRPGLSGKQLMFSDPDQLEQRGEDLYLAGHRLHVLFRLPYFEADQRVVRAFKQRRLQWFGHPMDMFLSDKRNLALLSAHADDPGLFTAEERELIHRHVPWSRRLVPGPSTRQGETIPSLVDYVLARREQMLIKPFIGHAGRDVHAGVSTEPEEWRRMVEEAAARGDVLVQELVESRPFLWHYRDQGIVECRAVWGVFRFGDRDGGAIMRILPMERPPGVLNAFHGAVAAAALVLE